MPKLIEIPTERPKTLFDRTIETQAAIDLMRTIARGETATYSALEKEMGCSEPTQALSIAADWTASLETWVPRQDIEGLANLRVRAAIKNPQKAWPRLPRPRRNWQPVLCNLRVPYSAI